MSGLVIGVEARVDDREAPVHGPRHGVAGNVVKEDLLQQVGHDVGSRGRPSPERGSHRHRRRGRHRPRPVPEPIRDPDRIGEEGRDDTQRGVRPRGAGGVPLAIGQAEGVFGAGRVAAADHSAPLRQRAASPEVAMGDLLEGGTHTKRDQQPRLLVPPAVGGNLRVVAVEDPSLAEGGRRGDAAAVGQRLVPLLRDQAGDGRHPAVLNRAGQEAMADPVEVEDDEALAHRLQSAQPRISAKTGMWSDPGRSLLHDW